MATGAASDADARVRAQYEAHPYPARNPQDETKRLITGSPSHLAEIVHYLYAGRAPFAEGRRFRALVAGGGTGDGMIMIAQQLADARADAEVVYVDISTAAARVAEARVRVRKLRNVRFVAGSLLDLDRLGLEGFDYIDCVGVLHHLADPAEGLRALVRALRPDGGMGLMVYATLGRTGVYHVQDALKLLGDGEAPVQERLALARALVADLPESNWLKRNPFINDHRRGGDAALQDLLLHARDRAYTVPELFALCAEAGVEITGFPEPARYEPATYLTDAALIERANALPWRERAALAELLAGSIKRHMFYAVPGSAAGRVAVPDSPDVVPVMRIGDAQAFARTIAERGRLEIELEGLKSTLSFGKLAPAILSRVDGARSLGEIHAALTTGTDWAAFKAAFDDLYAKLNGVKVMLLRRP